MRYKCDFYIKLFVFEKFMRYFCTLNLQSIIRNRDLVVNNQKQRLSLHYIYNIY